AVDPPSAQALDSLDKGVRTGKADGEAAVGEELAGLSRAHRYDIGKRECPGGGGRVDYRLDAEGGMQHPAVDNFKDHAADGLHIDDKARIFGERGGGDERVVIEAGMGQRDAQNESAVGHQSAVTEWRNPMICWPRAGSCRARN